MSKFTSSAEHTMSLTGRGDLVAFAGVGFMPMQKAQHLFRDLLEFYLFLSARRKKSVLCLALS